MPLYRYECDDCNKEMELLIRGAETPQCEACGSGKLSKLVSHIARPAHAVPEPIGCGAPSCCQLQGGGCGGMN